MFKFDQFFMLQELTPKRPNRIDRRVGATGNVALAGIIVYALLRDELLKWGWTQERVDAIGGAITVVLLAVMAYVIVRRIREARDKSTPETPKRP